MRWLVQYFEAASMLEGELTGGAVRNNTMYTALSKPSP